MKNKNIFMGLIFVLGAVLLVISQVVDFGQISVWSILVGAGLVAVTVQSIFRKSWFGVFVPLVFIYWMFYKPLSLPYISLWILIVGAVLLATGFKILFGRKKYNFKESKFNKTTIQDSEENIVINTYFSGTTKYLQSKNMKTCYISCKFGGAEIYFDGVVLNNNKAHIFIESKCAGVELYIPRNWNVINEVNCTAGGVDFTGQCFVDENSPTVIIKGNVLAAALEINYM